MLRECCELHAGARLGQLFALLGELAADQYDKSLWDIDDEDYVDASVSSWGRTDELRRGFTAIVDEPLTPAEMAELERRLALSDADPSRGIPAEVIFKRLREKQGWTNE